MNDPGSKARTWRDYAIFIGFILSAISRASMFGVMAYLGKAHLGYWREYEVASAWGVFMWPLSLLAVILGILSRSRARWRIALGLLSCIYFLCGRWHLFIKWNCTHEF